MKNGKYILRPPGETKENDPFINDVLDGITAEIERGNRVYPDGPIQGFWKLPELLEYGYKFSEAKECNRCKGHGLIPVEGN